MVSLGASSHRTFHPRIHAFHVLSDILLRYGVFLSWYIDHDDFPGASAFDYTFIGGVNFSAAMLEAPLVNILIKRCGTNRLMLIGCVLWLLGFLLAAESTQFWQLLLTQGLLVGIGTGV